MKNLLLLFAILILGSSSLHATHLMGGDLTYECLGSGQYRLTLKVYRDCNGINVGSYQVIYQTGNCGTGYQYMTKLSQREITPVCPGIVGTACNNLGGAYGVEEHVFQATFTISDTCKNVSFAWRQCCRNGAINTLNYPLGERMYVKTTIPNAGFCNNTPVFLNEPVPFVCANQLVNYNHGAVDPDGDELRFSLTPCLNNDNDPVTYNSGFSATSPLATTSGVSVDSMTGALSFTANTTQVAVLCVLVEEYRNGVKISEIMRDIQFTVLTCTNDSPTATGIDSTNIFTVDIRAGDSICFDIFSNDINPGDNLTMYWNDGIPDGTFTIDSSSTFPEGTFCWSPTINDVGTSIFNVIIKDDNCPLVGMNTYTYSINVSMDTIESLKNGSWSDPSVWNCNCLPTSDYNIVIKHDITQDADVTVGEGTVMRINSGTELSINSGRTLNSVGDFNNYGTVSGDGNLKLNGATAKYVRIGTANNVEIANNEGILAASNCTIKGVLKLTSGYFNNDNKDVVLESSASSTALIDNNGGTYVGEVVLERFISNSVGHHFLSSPHNGASIAQLDDDFNLGLGANYPFIHYYDETNPSANNMDGWISPSNTTHVMNQGEGYASYFNAGGGGTTIDMKGNPSSGNISVNLTNTATFPPPASIDTNACLPNGWNLIGNPYPSPIDFSLVVQSAPPSFESAFYVWDPSTESYDGWVDGVSQSGQLTSIIPAMQAFWVKSTVNTVLTFDNSMRVTDPTITTNPFFSPAPSTTPFARLKLSGQNRDVSTVIRFKQNATSAYDSQYDAKYLESSGGDAIDFATGSGVGPIGVNTRAPLGASNVLYNMVFRVKLNGTYTIATTSFTGFPTNAQLLLHDNQLNVTHVINTAPYSFIGDPTDAVTRFTLEVVPGIVSQIATIEDNKDWKVYRLNNNLRVSLDQEITGDDQLLIIYNQLGQQVFLTNLAQGDKTYDVSNLNLPSGNYIAKLGNRSALKFNW